MFTIAQTNTYTPPPNAKTYLDIENPIMKRPRYSLEYISQVVWDLECEHGLAFTADVAVILGLGFTQTKQHLNLARQGGWIDRRGQRGGWYLASTSA